MLLSRPSLPAAALLPRVAAPPPIIVARAVAVTALVLLFAATAAVLMAGSAKPALAPADARFISTRLVGVDQGVRAHFVRLATIGGLARAQNATRNAVAALDALARPVRASGDPAAALLAVAIADELRFLDAAGSVLMNPASPRLASLVALDRAARAALAALPGPAARGNGGVPALLRWRERRAAPVPALAGV
jgi:hypothetical protein